MTDSRLQVLLFDDDAGVAQALAPRLRSERVSVLVTASVPEARARLECGGVDGVILCSKPPDLLVAIRQWSADPSAVFPAERETPVWELEGWLAHLQANCSMQLRPGDELVGTAPSILQLREKIVRVARFTQMSVLVTGETGTGKELVAQAIHRLSAPAQPFVSINCAAVPAVDFERELFGSVSSDSLESKSARRGRLEEAGDGTLFLDEVGALPGDLQPKLLRSLETRRFRPLGAPHDKTFRARIVCATHLDLQREVNGFRPDLYFRLAGYAITCPPLRERRDDIPLLAEHFARRLCDECRLPRLTFAPEALQLLARHDFPDNVRELRAIIEATVLAARGVRIEAKDVELALRLGGAAPAETAPASELRMTSLAPISRPPRRAVEPLVGPGRPFASLGALERHVVLEVFADCGGSLSRAASILGIARSTLRDKLRRYGEHNLRAREPTAADEIRALEVAESDMRRR